MALASLLPAVSSQSRFQILIEKEMFAKGQSEWKKSPFHRGWGGRAEQISVSREAWTDFVIYFLGGRWEPLNFPSLIYFCAVFSNSTRF